MTKTNVKTNLKTNVKTIETKIKNAIIARLEQNISEDGYGIAELETIKKDMVHLDQIVSDCIKFLVVENKKQYNIQDMGFTAKISVHNNIPAKAWIDVFNIHTKKSMQTQCVYFLTRQALPKDLFLKTKEQEKINQDKKEIIELKKEIERLKNNIN